MAITCWVPGCNHNNVRDTCNFFRFPLDKSRGRWLTLIRREGTPGAGARVCSCHFVDGKKENGPTMFPHNETKLFKKHFLTPEKRKGKQRKVVTESSGPSFHTEVSEGLCSKPQDIFTSVSPAKLSLQEPLTEPVASTSSASTASSNPFNLSTTVYEAEIYLAKREIEKKDELIKTMRFRMTYEHIGQSDKLVLEYTGLPQKQIFEALISVLKDVPITYYLKWKVEKLPQIDQVLMTLMKLRQNFPYSDLAYRFQVSEGTVTNIIVTYIHVLHEVLFKQLMKNIPPREKNKSCLPNCASTFTNCRIILDCTEIICAVPRQSMKIQRLTYSSYKHRNTFKGLVGVAPNGVITYLSKLYPGSISDKAIVKHCGILDQLVPGDLVLADKGFLIQDILPSGVNLNIPPFLSTPQFTPEQVRRTECIAKARIHVERAICRMKSYKILSFIPERLFSYSFVIFQTVGALTNLQYPLIKEVSDFYEK